MFSVPPETLGQMGGGSAAGGVGGGMAGGGGQASYVPVPPPRLDAFVMDDLIDIVTSLVQPTTWDQVGGPATISAYGNLLVVNQTGAVHEQIETLFANLRAARRATPLLAVDARWLLLTPEQVPDLVGKEGQPTVDPAALDRLAATVPGNRSRLRALSGQSVHVASGVRQPVVTGVIPVVGSGVGYQPLSDVVNIGTLLEVRATVMPESDEVEVQLASTVTALPEESPPPGPGMYGGAMMGMGGEATGMLDRTKLRTEQFATALRLPLGRPVLVGSTTRSPTTAPADAPQPQLYLFIQVSRE